MTNSSFTGKIPNTELIIIPEQEKKELYSRVSDLLSIRNEKRGEFYEELTKLVQSYNDCAITKTF